METKTDLQKITEEISSHLVKEFTRILNIDDAICKLVSQSTLDGILKIFTDTMGKFQPTKTQLEIIENINKKEECALQRLFKNPLKMSTEQLKNSIGNKSTYCEFNGEFYFVGHDFKVHSLGLKCVKDSHGYNRFYLLTCTADTPKDATAEDLMFILSYTGHAPHDRNKFAYNVAGNLALQAGKEGFNLCTGNGLEPTGLCKLFFNDLTSNIFFTDFGNNYNFSFSRREDFLFDTSNYPGFLLTATTGLKSSSSIAYYEKQILLHFQQELLKHATPSQLCALVKELKEESNIAVSKLCEPRLVKGFFSAIGLFASSTKTPAYSNYETLLLRLFRDTMGTPSFIEKLMTSAKHPELPKELYQNIASKLDKNDYSSLSCVNHAFSKEMDLAIEESRVEFGRKF